MFDDIMVNPIRQLRSIPELKFKLANLGPIRRTGKDRSIVFFSFELAVGLKDGTEFREQLQ